MVDIIFESHATTVDNENHRSSGHNDIELSELGVQQAKELGERYADEQFDAIFCSDLQRSHKTAELAFGNRFPIVKDARLRECDYGDFTKANVLKSDDGKIYVLDFSVANWYPRLQELAVIAANLLHDDTHENTLDEKCSRVADQYSRFNTLTDEERQHLPAYALAGVAMEFMGAHQEKHINGNDTDETAYWFKLGREGLRKALR